MRRALLLLAFAALPALGYANQNTAQAEFAAGLSALQHHNYKLALQDFRQLASHGYAAAEYNLGVMYDIGLGVPQNEEKAFNWYRLAAAQGVTKAEYNLGSMYDNGQGVPQDYAKALTWYRLAAADGNSDAENNVGFMYFYGDGVPQDYVKAYKWLLLAKATMPATDHSYAKITRVITTVAGMMTPAQIAQAQQEASAWYAVHHHAGSSQ